MKFCFYTLGCKVNLSESQALGQLAIEKGHEIVEQDADVCIVNTCTVTSSGDHKNIRMFRKAKKENPNAIIAATGCFAQVDTERVRALEEVDIISGTGDRAYIIKQCENAVIGKISKDNEIKNPPREFEPLPAGVPEGRTRALLKVQDGCDNYCTYCIIPYARGHIRSMKLQEALEQVEILSKSGVHEVVLAGIEISSYGRDLKDDIDIVNLIDSVCTNYPDIRVRLSSLEPRTIDKRFCEILSKHKNLMHHFHLSLQSGCNSVLERMKRKYDTSRYLQSVELLREYFGNCSITTDLIVGFPNETEQELESTMEFIKKCNFASMHVFPYSIRKGTVAANMSGQIPQNIKEQRAKQITTIANEMENAFLQKFVGQKMRILIEHKQKDGTWSGHAQHHFTVRVNYEQAQKNHFIDVEIIGQNKNGLIGEVLV